MCCVCGGGSNSTVIDQGGDSGNNDTVIDQGGDSGNNDTVIVIDQGGDSGNNDTVVNAVCHNNDTAENGTVFTDEWGDGCAEYAQHP